jgi:release factor glutamine methyltransferase
MSVLRTTKLGVNSRYKALNNERSSILAKMKNSKEIFRNLQQQITLKEDPEEIQSILYLVVESVLGLSRADIISEKSILLDVSKQNKLYEVTERINRQEPIQYILGEAYFYGRKFRVTSAVLIPRPETELLVEEALKEINPFTPGTILDIGTGSGCIAVTLAKELPEKKIIAIDISDDALKIAKENASHLNAFVEFQKGNILTESVSFQKLEMIVSNPPYIASSEKEDMKKNVVDYEPHLALFVADDDPFVFYNAIALKGYPALLTGGKVLLEINERFGKKVSRIFIQAGFKNVQILKDLQGKDRIVSAVK